MNRWEISVSNGHINRIKLKIVIVRMLFRLSRIIWCPGPRATPGGFQHSLERHKMLYNCHLGESRQPDVQCSVSKKICLLFLSLLEAYGRWRQVSSHQPPHMKTCYADQPNISETGSGERLIACFVRVEVLFGSIETDSKLVSIEWRLNMSILILFEFYSFSTSENAHIEHALFNSIRDFSPHFHWKHHSNRISGAESWVYSCNENITPRPYSTNHLMAFTRRSLHIQWGGSKSRRASRTARWCALLRWITVADENTVFSLESVPFQRK